MFSYEVLIAVIGHLAVACIGRDVRAFLGLCVILGMVTVSICFAQPDDRGEQRPNRESGSVRLLLTLRILEHWYYRLSLTQKFSINMF